MLTIDDIKKQWRDLIKNSKASEKTKKSKLSEINQKFIELEYRYKGNPMLLQAAIEQLSNIEVKNVKDLVDFQLNTKIDRNLFIEQLIKSNAQIDEIINHIPPVEDTIPFIGKELQFVIQEQPKISHVAEKVVVHGAKIDDKYISIADLEHAIDYKFHLEQILKNVITNPENKFTTFQNTKDIYSINIFINGHHIARISDGHAHNFKLLADKYYNELYNKVTEYYEEYHHTRRAEHPGLKIEQIIRYKQGQHYTYDKSFEDLMGFTVRHVKNTDEKCLYAALFIALLEKNYNEQTKKYSLTCQSNPLLDCEFTNQAFTRTLSKYDDNNNHNLFYYTKLMYELLNPLNQEQDDYQICQAFEEEFKRKVIIVDYFLPFEKKPDSKDLILLYYNNHYTVITKFESAIQHITNNRHHRYCFIHQKFHSDIKDCFDCTGESYCNFCCKYHVPSKVQQAYKCQQCKKYSKLFPTEQCLINHSRECADCKFCNHCNKVHNLSKECGAKRDYNLLHFAPGKLKDKTEAFMTYDIESLFKPCPEDAKYTAEHIPFLICYDIIIYNKDTKKYEFQDLPHQNDLQNLPAGNYIINKNPFETFLQIIVKAQQQFKIKHIYAHNGGKYDNVLLLSYLMNNDTGIHFETCINNGVLLNLTIELPGGKVEIKDSIRLLNEPIKKFNKAYGLKDICTEYNFSEASKYEQSYTFLTIEMFDQYLYQGGKSATIKEYAQNNAMKSTHFENINEEQFQQYVEQNGDKDFVNQYIIYCQQDVRILSLGLIKMTRLIQQHEGVNMLNYLTAPSLSYNLYLAGSGKNMFQQEAQDFKFNHSKVEKQFLYFIQDADNLQRVNELLQKNFTFIRVIATNFKYANYNCDIAIETNEGKFIVEVIGEYWHGIANISEDDKYYQTIIERRTEHEAKMEFLTNTCQQNGFQEVLYVTDRQIKKDVQKITIDEAIHNRAVFKGGRTEYYYNYYHWDEKKKVLKGFDLSSLYPSMMLQNLPLRGRVIGNDIEYVKKLIKYALSITGTPQERLIKYASGCDEQKRLIQVKCKILPPKDLNIPVLCVTLNNKFLAPLCRTCAELKSKDVNHHEKCNHNDDQRALFGFFDEVELIHAINLGYKIIGKPYETHLYNITSFNDPEFKGNDFIRRQIFMKSLFSDPSDYNTEVLDQLVKDKIISDYQFGDKIMIRRFVEDEFQEIQFNAALKSLYKLFMNSTYGKTGQNKIRSSHQIGNYDFLYCQYNEQYHNNLTVEVINDHTLIYSYETDEELQMIDKASSNASLAGRITALARTVLYQLQRHIEQVYEGLVQYSDTDSVYALVPIKYADLKGFALETTFGIKTEEHLSNVFEYCCIAPKQFGYKNKEQTFATSKGISCKSELKMKDGKETNIKINQNIQQVIRDAKTKQIEKEENKSLYDVYYSLVLNPKQTFEIEQNKLFEKDPHSLRIYKMDQTKTIQIAERKRISHELQKNEEGEEFIATSPF